MGEKYCVAWKSSLTGAQGRGRPLDQAAAEAEVEYCNREFPDLHHWCEVVAQPKTEDVMATKDERMGDVIVPRPLAFPLEDYWGAPSGIGPLASEWADKPHRLLYNLIAALLHAGHHE